MNDRLRVNDDFNLLRAQIKQMHGLDHFQRLVEHGCAVDGYFQAHGPIGMVGCHGRCHARHFIRTERPEGATRSGQNDAFHAVTLVPVKNLMDGIVFAVDRQQTPAGLFDLALEECTGRDQAFLVGKGYVRALSGGRQCGREPCHANNAGHDPLGVASGGFNQGGLAGGDFYADSRQGIFELGVARFVGRDGDFSTASPGLLRQQINIAPAADSADLKGVAAAQMRHHIQRVASDGAGGTKNADTALAPVRVCVSARVSAGVFCVIRQRGSLSSCRCFIGCAEW